MKRKTIGALLCGFLITGSVFGQIQDFNLSDYKLPDLKRRTLELDVDLTNYYSYSKYDDSQERSYYKRNASQFHSLANLNFTSFLNTAYQQKEIAAGINFASHIYKEKKDKELDQKSSNFSPQIFYNRINRKYFKSNRFYETDLLLDYNLDRDRYFNTTSDYTSTMKTHIASVFFPLKMGIGRIEPVEDARLAVYLLDELSKQNSIHSEISKDEILDFAGFISQLKNKRFFDSRLRRIYELEAIDAFLDSNNYSQNKNIHYFTTLSDFWDYGNRPNRYSGTRIAAAIYPGYSYKHYGYKDDQIENSLDYGYDLNALIVNAGFEFKKEKPIDLYWQNTITLNGFFGLIEGKSEKDSQTESTTLRLPNFHLEYLQKIGYYPNTRTDMEFSYSAQFFQLIDKTDEENDIRGLKAKAFKGAADLSINYYISPKFRLNIFAGLYYIWQDSDSFMFIDNFDNLSTSNYYVNQLSPYGTISNSFMTDRFYSSFKLKILYSIY